MWTSANTPTVNQTNSETEQVVCVQSEENSMPPNKRPCAGMKIKKIQVNLKKSWFLRLGIIHVLVKAIETYIC
jgi:hypothetical protein